MPPITRLFVKTALVYFVIALLTGLALAANGRVPLPQFVGLLNPVYFHLFMVGWVTQLIIGVAYWMFPKYSREKPRGHDWLSWSTYGLLNTGLILRIFAEPATVLVPGSFWGTLLALSATLQWLGGMAFVANTWPRVKEK
ncbi:MAG: hypothetical protein KatS3mg050_3226 [Litorilinea sp.]|nr:MAG: hypothetical protein KatS3mg050_3226 [Litorilinea sp.]